MIGDFIYEHGGKIFFLILFMLVALLFFAGQELAEQRDRFMSQCMVDYKEYECVAMWRAGDSRRVIVPTVIR